MRFRYWLDNGDWTSKGLTAHDITEQIRWELTSGTRAALITSADLTKEKTLAALDDLKVMIESSEK